MKAPDDRAGTQPRPWRCTMASALFCPLHGACTCGRDSNGCPLHAPTSGHPSNEAVLVP